MSNRDLTVILILASFVALILETTVINFPFIFFLGAILLILVKKVRLYILVFMIAFTTDALRVSNFGLTSLFLVGSLFTIFLYERYSGSSDYLVAAIIVAAFGFFYVSFSGYSVGLTVTFYILAAISYFFILHQKSKKNILI